LYPALFRLILHLSGITNTHQRFSIDSSFGGRTCRSFFSGAHPRPNLYCTVSIYRGVGSSSNIQAFSSMLVHFPLVPAWLCLRCCLKWSALKNFLDELHSRNLCTSCRCLIRSSQSWSVACRGALPPLKAPVPGPRPDRGNSSPQYPQVSASPGLLVESWKALSYPERAEHDHE
jgi:hypothetical protein